MLKHLNIFKWIGWLWAPIEKNGAFFVFMYVLGWICSVVELPLNVAKPEPYELWTVELFFDLYVVCILLMVFPRKLRIGVKALLYILLYGVAVVDMFCYVRFESTLTPTMLMLVGETNSREAGEFFTSYLSMDTVYSPVGSLDHHPLPVQTEEEWQGQAQDTPANAEPSRGEGCWSHHKMSFRYCCRLACL